jgi:hypothetical protein
MASLARSVLDPLLIASAASRWKQNSAIASKGKAHIRSKMLPTEIMTPGLYLNAMFLMGSSKCAEF